MSDLAGLVTAAVVGTGARPLRLADLPEPVAAVLGTGPTSDADRLLDAAAAYAILLRGRVAAGPDVPPLRLPAPTRPPAPAAVVALLHRVRGAGPLAEALQHELLAALAAHGLTVPPDVLLVLLGDVARPGVARDVAGLLDERGWAFVALDPVWSAHLARAATAGRTADPVVWEEGTLPQRVAYLAAVRAADPAAGRALLAGRGNAGEPVEAREAFVRTLATGLGADDEEFLEARLDDRARAVRLAAADLLARLPGSAYVGRAEAIVATHVSRRHRPLRPAVTVVRPVAVSAATRRDGYREADHDRTPAERLHLLDAIAAVPPARWPALVGATAVELAGGPAEYHGSPIDLAPALAVAAVRHGDAALAAVLTERDDTLLAGVRPVLRPADSDRLLVAALAAGTDAEPVSGVLAGPLSPPVSVAALEAVLRLAANRRLAHRVPELLGLLALQADPLAAPPLLAALRGFEERLDADAGPALRRAVGAAATALQLRQAIAEALPPSPVPPTAEEG